MIKKILGFIFGSVILVGAVVGILYFTGVFNPAHVLIPSLDNYSVFLGQDLGNGESEDLKTAYNATKDYAGDLTVTSKTAKETVNYETLIKRDGDITYLEVKTVVGETESISVWYFEKIAGAYKMFEKQADETFSEVTITETAYNTMFVQDIYIFNYFRIDNNDGKSSLNEYSDRKATESDATKFDSIGLKFKDGKIAMAHYKFIETVDSKETATETTYVLYNYDDVELTLPTV